MNRKWAIHFFNVISLKKWVQLLFIVIMFCFSFSGTLPLYGEQTWHGNAAMIRRGEFATAGFFAASNSFPLNTKILVKNLNNGYTTEVIVIQRLSDFYSVFLLLSDEASRELGMNENDVINVEVVVLKFGTGDTIGLPDDLPYNPDPDVFPLPTIPEEYTEPTPQPTPFPGEATPGPTAEATPEMTGEPTLEPTPLSSPEGSPEITLSPEEATPESTPEPTPEVTPEATMEPTLLLTDETLSRNPQKNLFIPSHEDESYVLEDMNKPEEMITDEPDFKPEIVSVKAFDGKAIDGSISPPDSEEKGDQISTIAMSTPDVENPVVEDRTRPDEILPEDDYKIAAEPGIVEKEKPIPDPSNDVPLREEYDIALDPEEPKVPEGLSPDPSNEVPDSTVDEDIALIPEEPTVQAKDIDVPDPSNEMPYATGDEDIAMTPEEPEPPSDADRGLPDPSNEIPKSTGDEDIAMNPEEPEPPSDADKGIPDPSNEIPETTGDEDIAMSPEEPEPPTDAEKGIPDPSNEIPDATGDEDIAMSPEEPEPPTDAEKGIPDPSNELPEPDKEADITYNPVDPNPPSDSKTEPDTDTEPDITYEPIEGEEEIVITFEETGPKPPEDDGKYTPLHETDGKEESYFDGVEKGTYFIQLAAYTEKAAALAIEKKYADIYPIDIYPVKDKMLEIYKVLVGPLNKHESDTLLYRFKALGFKDAFVKYNK
ncbi:MAG: SPOR domain-containing protein [Spirochaetales bacterium]|nr:SPOR domain-containing protein [Spirochaetales bacterium]